MYENYYAVIMAGGGGTRLWPVSRQGNPKQMIQLFGERSMFQISVDRLTELFPPERICVVTSEEQSRQLRPQYPEIPPENFILEPEPKNTASVVGLAAITLQKRNPNAVMAILTADHYIGNVPRFHKLLKTAYTVANQGFLVTLGIQPTYPSTAYGYIHMGSEIGEYEGLPVHNARRFLEKPDEATASELFASGDYAWNSGMFVWKVDQIIVEFARQMPDLYTGLQLISRDWNSDKRAQTIKKVWDGLERISIDYGVMEGAENVAIIPASELAWSDVGSWESLFEVLEANGDGNIAYQASHLPFDTHNTLVFGNNEDRLVVTIGVDDLVIVDTGDVLLVCSRDSSQQVREVVQYIKKNRNELA
ncbi:MAG: mannose-1-phosphate guanylyltransferase [Anaerolineales bacterium]|jgi:mannose-1-phosphate guanylyltransferase